jgi:hypothetical protein
VHFEFVAVQIKLECVGICLITIILYFNDDLYIINITHNKKWIDDLDAQKKKFREIFFNVL